MKIPSHEWYEEYNRIVTRYGYWKKEPDGIYLYNMSKNLQEIAITHPEHIVAITKLLMELEMEKTNAT